jgi:hypothetical protein
MNKAEAKLKAKRLTNDSKGNVKIKRLVNATKGIMSEKYGLGEPLISHIHEGETIHFLFLARQKCPEIHQKRESGLLSNLSSMQVSPPFSDGASVSHNKGAYFSLITDNRVAFITGVHTTDGSSVTDEVFQRELSQIQDVEINKGSVKISMVITDIEGTKIKFWGRLDEWKDLQRAESYINRIIDTHSSDSNSASSKQTQSSINESSDIDDLNPEEFEHYVADIWEERGWNVEVTQSSNDRGIDIVATKSNPFQQKQLIQAKKYAQENSISSTDVQQYASLYQQEESVDSVVIVTTSYFTTNAKDRAEDLNVKLVDGEKLEEMSKKHN